MDENADDYWDRVAEAKDFTHPLNSAWLARWASQTALILDYGCGYGRVLSDLAALGYRNGVGFDRSAAMIERGHREHPALDLRALSDAAVPIPDESFDLVVLFAVLTCIASDDTQHALIADVFRLLRPGGLLYLSDMPMQAGARTAARYEAGVKRFGTWGVFETDDGAVLRHHPPERFDALLVAFERIESETIAVRTMNGNPAKAIQILGRRPPR